MTVTPEGPPARGALGALFAPHSVAVVGATETRGFGARVLTNLMRHRFPGPIYPVNPNRQQVRGLACHPSVTAIAEPVDLAVIAIPSADVPAALADAAQAGVRLAIVLSAAADAAESAALNQAITRLRERGGMRVLGPNCLGFLGVASRTAAAATAALEVPELLGGSLALISESGSTGFAAVFRRAHENGVGLGHVVSVGNQADLDTAAVLEWLVDDPGTAAISILTEGLRDPARFRRAARRAAELGKPVVVLKVGRSAAGQRSAATHTGAIAGSDAVYDAVFEADGVLRVHDVDDLWEVPAALLAGLLPRGRRVAVCTGSGGVNGIASDLLAGTGFRLDELGADTLAALAAVSPAIVGSNPVDLTGSTAGGAGELDVLARAVGVLRADPALDAIITAISASNSSLESWTALAPRISGPGAPCMLLAYGSLQRGGRLGELLEHGVVVARSAARCVQVLDYACRYVQLRAERSGPPEAAGTAETPAGPAARLDLDAAPPGLLSPAQAGQLLRAYGIAVPAQRLASDAAQAMAAAEAIGYPVAMKQWDPALLHKTEADAVRLGLRDAAMVLAAFEQLDAQRPGTPVLVQEMVTGTEFVLGIRLDPELGPAVLIGAGGVLVELLNDHVLLAPPLDRARLHGRLARLRTAPLFAGYRGRPPLDAQALIEAALGIAALAQDLGPLVAGLEINPLMLRASGEGAVAVDARIVLR
jgi:acyl-CoA synthetase (NDP forming)